jgi:hypothetical protein
LVRRFFASINRERDSLMDMGFIPWEIRPAG